MTVKPPKMFTAGERAPRGQPNTLAPMPLCRQAGGQHGADHDHRGLMALVTPISGAVQGGGDVPDDVVADETGEQEDRRTGRRTGLPSASPRRRRRIVALSASRRGRAARVRASACASAENQGVGSIVGQRSSDSSCLRSGRLSECSARARWRRRVSTWCAGDDGVGGGERRGAWPSLSQKVVRKVSRLRA